MYILYKQNLGPNHVLSSNPKPMYVYDLLDSFNVRVSLPFGIACPRLLREEPGNPHGNGSYSD